MWSISIGAPSQTGVHFSALFPIGARAYYPQSTVLCVYLILIYISQPASRSSSKRDYLRHREQRRFAKNRLYRRDPLRKLIASKRLYAKKHSAKSRANKALLYSILIVQLMNLVCYHHDFIPYSNDLVTLGLCIPCFPTINFLICH